MKDTVTHSSLRNNDMNQDTGIGTSQYESDNLVEEYSDKDILWAVPSGLPSRSDQELPLLGLWTSFMKLTCKAVTPASLLKYLPANEKPPEHDVCKQYLEFIMEVMGCLDIPRIFVHAGEQVYACVVHLI